MEIYDYSRHKEEYFSKLSIANNNEKKSVFLTLTFNYHKSISPKKSPALPPALALIPILLLLGKSISTSLSISTFFFLMPKRSFTLTSFSLLIVLGTYACCCCLDYGSPKERILFEVASSTSPKMFLFPPFIELAAGFIFFTLPYRCTLMPYYFGP